MAARVAIVLAHPDDETLACGALLPRLDDLTLVHVTDGAPRGGVDAARQGFPTAAAYAAARRCEVEAALFAGGVAGARLVSLDVPDQGAALAMADVARCLVQRVREADLVLTHAFEGGHPDHDATAFAVRAAVALVGASGEAPTLIEVPLYRAGPDCGWLRQSFAADRGSAAVVLRLTDEERRRKAAMIAAHATQRETLAGFGTADELYRLAAPTDFTRPPSDGAILYERYGWGMTGARFVALAAEAARELGLPAAS